MPVFLSQHWEFLGTAEITSNAASFTVSGLPERRYLMVAYRIAGLSAVGIPRLQFNSDTGNNYGSVRSDDSGGTTKTPTVAGILLLEGTATLEQFGWLEICNISNRRKSIIFRSHSLSAVATGSGDMTDGRGNWNNTVDQITSITLDGNGVNIVAPAEIVVWGADLK